MVQTRSRVRQKAIAEAVDEVEKVKSHVAEDLHLARKGFHIFVGVYCMFEYAYRTLPISVAILGTWDLLFLVGEITRRRFPSIQKASMILFRHLVRAGEETRLSGSAMFLVGLSTCLAIFPKIVTAVALGCLTFGDPIAAAVGALLKQTRYRHKLPFSPNKSLEGCLVAMFFCVFVTRWVLYTAEIYWNAILPPHLNVWAISCLIGIVAGLSETITIRIPVFGIADDNVTMPLIIGAFVWPLFLYLNVHSGVPPLVTLYNHL